MTFTVNALFLALEQDNYAQLWTSMQSMTQLEIVTTGTAIGPNRIRELLYRYVRQSLAVPKNPLMFTPKESGVPAAVLPEILAEAFNDRTFLGAQRDPTLTQSIRAQLRSIHNARASTQQIVLYRDVTRTLAQPNACPASLSDADYTAAATRHGITMAAIKAVAQVESGGRSGFDDKYRAKILFEAHHFRKYTARLFDLSHPHLSCARQTGKKYYKWDQYSRLYEAMVLDPAAAVKACSWGKFQVLGSNHNGWPDAISFAQAMQVSETNHLKSFEAYCVTNGLITHLKNKNWAKFAAGYNGANYAEFSYDTKIETAYKKYGGT